MTLEELRNQIRDLGFEETDTINEYSDIVNRAINRAISEINTTVRPIVRKKTITQDCTFDMSTLSDFLDFYGKPKTTIDNKRITFNDYEIEGKTIITLDNVKSDVDIYYKAIPTKIDQNTVSSFVIELDEVVQPLIATLASFYVWLDDDERKAAIYQNRYDDLKEQILYSTVNAPSVKFYGGVRWER